MYKLNPECYGTMFAIPASVTDTYLAEASGNSIKTLLKIFRNPSGVVSVSEISEALSLSADEVLSALDYWVAKGILLFTDEGGNVKFVPKAKTPEAPSKQNTDSLPAPAKSVASEPIVLPKPTMEQIAARIQEDETVRSLLTEAQGILGRTFGLDMQATLLMLFDTYGLQKEVILTLIQHLADNGRGSTANILRIGKIWAEREINTLDAANEYIQNDSAVNRLFTEFRIATGISNPKPTQKQSEYLLSWMQMHISMELLIQAYEETVERTGKPSFAYMDKILKNWHNDGLKTIEELEKFRQAQAAIAKKERECIDFYHALRRATGITSSKPTQGQNEYIKSWIQLGISPELAAKAYEETIEHTGKPQFGYMNAVLLHWNDDGLKSVDDVHKMQTENRSAFRRTSWNNESSFDLGEALEKATLSLEKYAQQKKVE